MNTNADLHDIDALVSLATEHADKWGDSCHHALGNEIVRLREIVKNQQSRILHLEAYGDNESR